VKNFLTATARAVKYGAKKWSADWQASRPGSTKGVSGIVESAYLIGCGRSGTTICGAVLKSHPNIQYYFEPYHFWATIDPTIDVLNFYHTGASHLLLDAEHCTDEAKRRFERLMLEPTYRRGRRVMLEKTPFNACRIGYIDALSPGCKFIHLVRDGVDVVRSIDRLSRDTSYQILGRRDMNRWWGRGGCKWTALSTDGFARNYFADEIPLMLNYESKGAYEWLVTMAEMDRWRSRLGDRLLEISYVDLTERPEATLKRMCEFLSVPVDEKWLANAMRRFDKPRHNYGVPLVLPPKMTEAFNAYQERFDFPNRAVAGIPEQVAPIQMAVISNEPTPYRLHVLQRMYSELEEVQIHNIFSHTISNPSMPWQMRINAHLNPIFFPKFHLWKGRPLSWRGVQLFRKMRDYVIQHKIQMVILLGYNDLSRLLFLNWAHRTGLPVLLAADSNIFGDAKTRWWVKLIKRPYVRWVLRHLAGVMPMGTCGRAYFRSYLDHRLPEFLFPYEPDYDALRAVDPKQVDEFRQKYGLAAGRKRLLYSGRLISVKRVDVLLEAFSRVALARPDWDVVIAGDGPLRRALERSLPEAVKPRVKWLGFQQFDQLILAYHACDVLVHPSEYEPWALVINEAVACELPVISTSVVGAAVELVRHKENGLLVPPRSVEGMADAIWEITRTDRYLEMKASCLPILEGWRKAADPVQAVRDALRHFGLIWRQPVAPATRQELEKPPSVEDLDRPIIASAQIDEL
jgi:glycosyltransferase involved in cell wall biosynthesis